MRKPISGWALSPGIVATLLIIDQILKIYIKLNFTIGERADIIPGLIEFQFIENGVLWPILALKTDIHHGLWQT